MSFRVEIDEAALRPADLPFMADLVTRRTRPVVIRLVIHGPVGHVLHALMARIQEIEIHGRRIIALLDKLDLKVAGVVKRNAHLDRRGFAAIGEPVAFDPVYIEERADTHHFRPVLQGGFNVAHDIAVLADLSEKPAQTLSPSDSSDEKITRGKRHYATISRPCCGGTGENRSRA